MTVKPGYDVSFSLDTDYNTDEIPTACSKGQNVAMEFYIVPFSYTAPLPNYVIIEFPSQLSYNSTTDFQCTIGYQNTDLGNYMCS